MRHHFGTSSASRFPLRCFPLPPGRRCSEAQRQEAFTSVSGRMITEVPGLFAGWVSPARRRSPPPDPAGRTATAAATCCRALAHLLPYPAPGATEAPSPAQGKTPKRVWRKATGLNPACAGQGSRVAGRMQHLLMGCVSRTAMRAPPGRQGRSSAPSVDLLQMAII
jgi:hypothetical protein